MASARENDLNPDVRIGLKLPFNRGKSGLFSQSQTTLEQAGSNIKNLLLTAKGERVMQPDFGSRLRALLFEQILDVTTDDLKTNIQSDISQFFPNVEVVEIEFNNQPDENTINFTLKYRIVNFGIEDSVNILLQ